MVDTFAFIIHPINPKRDISRKYPLLGKLAPDPVIFAFSPLWPPVFISEIEGIVSEWNGKEVRGLFLACPLTPRHLLELPEKRIYHKIIETGQLAEKMGAQILGLGAYTSVAGDAGITVAKALDVPVTTGDSYTVGLALEALERAAEMLDINFREASAAIMGATGAIGRVCAQILAERVSKLTLVGRSQERLDMVADEIVSTSTGTKAEIAVADSSQALREAQMVITVTSALQTVIEPEDLMPGSVICDVARPRDVSARVASVRDDVLVIDGGMVDVPGQVNFNFDFGFPPGKAYACMAETMALALEGRFEDYTLGKQIERSRVEEITAIAGKHGFRLSGFRSFEREVDEQTIERVRKKARLSKGKS